jgi:hypothetical protein
METPWIYECVSRGSTYHAQPSKGDREPDHEESGRARHVTNVTNHTGEDLVAD